MPLSPYPTDYVDILTNSDFPGELLNAPYSGENYLLVVGPNITQSVIARDHQPGHIDTYLGWLLDRMVTWCIQEHVVQQQDTINDLRALLENEALIPAAYRIEEYLATKQEKQQCLRAILHPHNQVRAIHYFLTRISFRGFITTSYDTGIETAYEEIQHSQLRKFYKPSLSEAIHASRKKQPFILKLYGDLNSTDSIHLGHRLLTGLYAENDREQLRELFAGVSTLFIGFEDTDPDLNVLKNLTQDRVIIHPEYPDLVLEPEEIAGYDLLETGTAARNATVLCELLIPTKTVPAIDKLQKGKKEANRHAPDTPSDAFNAERENEEEKQHEDKTPITVFIFYDLEDKEYKDKLEKIVRNLSNKEIPFEIQCKSGALGESLGYKTGVKDPLQVSELVILLISMDFLGSDYYDKKQIQEVIDRHNDSNDSGWVCPILVRKSDWEGTQFDEVKMFILPQNHIPISKWGDADDAYFEISGSLTYALTEISKRMSS
jgi:SIR2-like domain